jgi:hemerythrin-like domain-containing protein
MPLDPSALSLFVLREEHVWIGRMLECLERLVEDSSRRGRLEAECAAEILALFVHFADGLHQQREEACLFPRLLARSRSVEERVGLGKLCGDHEEERRALRALSERLLGAIYGRGPELQTFAREGALFVRLHRQHLGIENERLLPLAERLLQPEDDQLLCELYRRLERGEPSPAAIGARIQRLHARLLGASTAHEL